RRAARELLELVGGAFETIGAEIEAARFRAGLTEALRVAREANRYLNDEAPWALMESDRPRAAPILYVALRVVDSLKTLFTPFIPFSSQRLHELLGYEGFLARPLEFREIDEEGET